MSKIDTKINKTKGKVQEELGRFSGNKKLEAKGKINQTVANAKQSVDKIKKNFDKN